MVQNRWGLSGIGGDGPGWVGIMGSKGGWGGGWARKPRDRQGLLYIDQDC